MGKSCIECNLEKDTSQFSKCSRRPDGLQQACKQCNKAANDKFREERPEYQRDYWRTPRGKATRRQAQDKYFDSEGAGIYIVKNLINGRLYIGQSQQIARRKLEWRLYLKHPGWRELFVNESLKSDIDKYGSENFSLNVIERMENDKKKLKEREKYYIRLLRKFNDLYNYQNNTEYGIKIDARLLKDI